MPGVMVKVATAPVPPVLPHAPQVSQVGESSTLLSTVALLGLPDGVGDGEAAGLGDGDAEAIGVLAEVAGLPPHPIAIDNKNNETAHKPREKERGQLRTLDLLTRTRCQGEWRVRTVLSGPQDRITAFTPVPPLSLLITMGVSLSG